LLGLTESPAFVQVDAGTRQEIVFGYAPDGRNVRLGPEFLTRMKSILLTMMFSLLMITARAESEARIFEGGNEKRIELKEYKRGLFFGSCGPSTKSLQWEYSFTLAGQGLVYEARNIGLKDRSLKPVEVTNGKITVNEKRKTVRIDIRIRKNGAETDFPYNGQYKLKSKS
jgi:hypothetical protein